MSSSNNAFCLSVRKSCTASVQSSVATAPWPTHHCTAEVSAKRWTYKTTEISMESRAPGCGFEPSSSITPPVTNGGHSDISSLSSTAISNHTTATAEESDVSRSEVKLPKNAVELIAWAITECNTTTPTLTQIASHIQAHVPTYREEELSVLIKMVQHHLNKNNPAYFLPVLSPAGHVFHNPSLARWAINRQVVTVGEDGTLIRRRHRSHAYASRRSVSSLGGSSSLVTPSRLSPVVMSAADGASSGSGQNAQFASYCSSADSYFSPPTPLGPPNAMAQNRPNFGRNSSSPLTPFGCSSAGNMPASQPSPLGPGLYGVPLSTSGGIGHLPPGPSPSGLAYQLSLC